MKQDLQDWANENKPKDTMVYVNSFWDQVTFVRDMFPRILYKNYEESQKHKINVISTHTSKSICLPVYQICLSNDTVITVRANFHDWNISINSKNEIDMDMAGLFGLDENFSSCYFEGFPAKFIHGSYSESKKHFSFALSHSYEVYMFIRLLAYNMKLKE